MSLTAAKVIQALADSPDPLRPTGRALRPVPPDALPPHHELHQH